MKEFVYYFLKSDNPRAHQKNPLLDSVYQHCKILGLAGWLEV